MLRVQFCYTVVELHIELMVCPRRREQRTQVLDVIALEDAHNGSKEIEAQDLRH